MKKLIDLTIPVLIAFTWSVLAITTLHEIGQLATAVAGPSPDLYGPAIQIAPEPEVSRHVLHVAGDAGKGVQA